MADDEMEKAAREFLKTCDYNEDPHLSTIMADFARSLNKWTAISTEDDLPKVGDTQDYLFHVRKGADRMDEYVHFKWDAIYLAASWPELLVNDFDRYLPIPPYNPKEKVKGDLRDGDN